MKPTRGYSRRVHAALRELGIDENRIAQRKLRLHAETPRLTMAGLGTDGRDKFLSPPAARAWRSMQARAASEGVPLLLVSAFRSLEFQTALLRDKLKRGLTVGEILQVNAPPGYSEHHTGRAVDVGTPDCAPLDEAFETTAAFAWLSRHAERHGFSLSYPRGNSQGFVYEPWHWRHRG